MLCNNFGGSVFLSGLFAEFICLWVDHLLNVHLELEHDLFDVLFPGVIATHLITPDLWVYVKWLNVDFQGVLIGYILNCQ